MNEKLKKNGIIIAIIIIVVILAGIGIFAAMRLNQSANQDQIPKESPTTAASTPLASLPPSTTACILEFSLDSVSASTTPIASGSGLPTAKASATAKPTVKPTATATAKASAGLGGIASTASASPTIRPTATAKASATVKPTTSTNPSATPASLPPAGVGLPTIVGIVAGLVLMIGALALAI